jgi:hypothetical protein
VAGTAWRGACGGDTNQAAQFARSVPAFVLKGQEQAKRSNLLETIGFVPLTAGGSRIRTVGTA